MRDAPGKRSGTDTLALITLTLASGLVLAWPQTCPNCEGTGRAFWDVEVAWQRHVGRPDAMVLSSLQTECSRCDESGRVTRINRLFRRFPRHPISPWYPVGD